MEAFLTGFGFSFSLIMAIGAQSSFVLRQGLLKQHIFWICIVCILSDSLLISAGVFGFSSVLQLNPLIEKVMIYGGVVFLFFYGLSSFRRAFFSNNAMQVAGGGAQSLKVTVLTCLAFTWLNPHVYLDTIVLLGSIATNFAEDRLFFALGSWLASICFFFGLGYGASLLRRFFVKPVAWKILDTLIGILMWSIAGRLLYTSIMG